EAAGGERLLQGAVLGEDLRRRLRPDAAGAGQLVGGVATQGDEVRNLLGLDAIALPYLRRANPRDLADASGRLEDRHAVRGQLERVAVGGGDERLPTARGLVVGGGGQEVVRLVAGPLRDRKPERGDEVREQRQLLEQLVIELSSGLIAVERLVPV